MEYIHLNKDRLVSLNYTGYSVKPFKEINHVFYQCELGEEDCWTVQGDLKDYSLSLARFKEQDEAHQFAELLTICLSQIKAFQDEHNKS